MTRCINCQTSELQPMPGYERAHLVKCRICRLVFSRRVPSQDELDQVYSSYPRQADLSPITARRYQDLLRSFEAFKLSGRLLDVGAGSGHFCQAALEQGWQAYATEYDEVAVASCRSKGVSTALGPLRPENYQPHSFDLIHWAEVIEHILNPREELQNFLKLLRPGGVVYVTTPNLNALVHRLLGPRWNNFAYPEHLAYYTPATLTDLFRRAGFKKLWLRTSGFSPANFRASRAGSEYTSDESLRQHIEARPWLSLVKRLLNQLLNATGSGEALQAMFQA